MKVLPVIAVVFLVAAIVPIVADDSSAYTLNAYVFECTNEGFDEGEYFIAAYFEFTTAQSTIPSLNFYTNSSCTNYIAQGFCQSLSNGDTTADFTVEIPDCPSTLYAKLQIDSQYSIFEVEVYEGSTSVGSDVTTSFSLSSSYVDSVTVSDSVYSFNYIWVFDSDISEYYSSATVELCSDSDCSEVVSTYDDLGGLTYDSVISGLSVWASTSLSDFYLKVHLGTQYWVSHVVLSTSEEDPSVVDVDTDDVTDSSDSSGSSSSDASLIFDSADTLVKIFLVLGVILVVVFVVFGFGVRNTRRRF